MSDIDKQKELSEEERLMKEIAESEVEQEKKGESSKDADPESVNRKEKEDPSESNTSDQPTKQESSAADQSKDQEAEKSEQDVPESNDKKETAAEAITEEESRGDTEESEDNKSVDTVESKEQSQEESSEAKAGDQKEKDTDEDEDNIDKTVAESDTGTNASPESQVVAREDEEEIDEDEDDEEDEEDERDYSNFSKEEIVNEIEEVLKGDQIKKIERKVKELKTLYNDLFETEQKEALERFKKEGGSEVDFQYAGDALDNRFSTLYEKYKERRHKFYNNLEKEKEANLQKKHEILEKLRNVVDGEETTTSIGTLKEIQNEWRSVGPIPNQYAKSLWATYNILIDRFYDNRSIYFELKELDRKKNLEGKLELCEKAEALLDYDNIRDAVKELNELHEEFKHIGPVPKEVQEDVWQRFKAASDAVYAKRKEYVGELKKELFDNLEEKKKLVEEVSQFSEFDSDKITEWNEKTREILDIQKRWEKIGGLPREHAREVNKGFWSNFKSFFNNKNKFFKKLEGQRDENLKKKEELVKKAEELKESTDWENTANTLKNLQKEWKNIGPVPEKVRNEVYKKFKSACDTFFDRRREHSKDIEKDYKENLKKKEEICGQIEEMAEKGSDDIDRFKELQMEFDKIGYVPRNAIRKIQRKFEQATNKFLGSVDLPDSEKSELKFTAEINRLKSGPNANSKINRKEGELRRLIGKLENDIALWKNNLEFFAESKTADKLREDFTKKIESATAELDALKEELKVLNKI